MQLCCWLMCHLLEGDADASWNGLFSCAKESVIILSNLINVTFKLHLRTKKQLIKIAVQTHVLAQIAGKAESYGFHTKTCTTPSEIRYQHAQFARSSTVELNQPLSGHYSLCWQFSYWSHTHKKESWHNTVI